MISSNQPFDRLLGSGRHLDSIGRKAYTKASKRLFSEALTYYLAAMRERNFLSRSDTEIMLLAVHGLIQLENYPLARALLQLAFSYLTAEELLTWIERGREVQHDLDCEVPF